MIDRLGINASSRSSLFSKCFMIGLVVVLLSITAAFVFFAIMRQSHPADAPAQKTYVVTRSPLTLS